MIQECRAKYYFSGLARKIRAWVTNCPDCIANKRIDTRQIRPQMLSLDGRLPRSRHTAKPTVVQWIPTHHHDDGRLFTLPFRIPDTGYDSENSNTMHHRRNDNTLLPTIRHPNRQRITVQIRSNQPNSPNVKHTDQPCLNKACPNNRHLRTDSRLTKDSIKDINGRTPLHVAQICTNRKHELQHKQTRKFRL